MMRVLGEKMKVSYADLGKTKITTATIKKFQISPFRYTFVFLVRIGTQRPSFMTSWEKRLRNT
jgi:hypothetical protein